MALEFASGEEQHIDLANSIDLAPELGVFTIVIRFKTSHDFSAANGVIYSDYGGAADDLVYLAIDTANKMRGIYRDDGKDKLEVVNQGAVVNDGAIHTAVWVRESQTTARMYLDAVSIGTDTNALIGNIDTSDYEVPNIACQYGVPLYLFYIGGLIELRIYKGKAFSAAEAEIFHHSQGADNIIDNLVGRWLMNEKADGETATVANSVIDISGNGNHGSPANSPVYRAAPVKLVKPIL